MSTTNMRVASMKAIVASRGEEGARRVVVRYFTESGSVADLTRHWLETRPLRPASALHSLRATPY